ncbi:MAG: helix-turn-helix domain-containing protein [Patescibacteria group bacterium]
MPKPTAALQQELKKAGLTEKEAAVYHTLLALGPSRVAHIAKHADLKRPITYVTIEALMKRGYVALVPGEKKTMYMALSPEIIYDEVRDKFQGVAKLLPHMMALFAEGRKIPKLHVLEGTKAMLKIYRNITHPTNDKVRDICAFVSPHAAPKDFDANWGWFSEALNARKITLREIFTEDSLDHPYWVAVQRLPNHESRVVSGFAPFESDTLLYDKKIVLFSFEKKFVAVIESADLFTSFMSLFEVAWQSGKNTK